MQSFTSVKMLLYDELKNLISLRGFVTLALCYVFVKAIYGLFFHQLSSIPGPRIAALTSWYEFWWNCPKKGRYMFKIEEMHQQYGPIVRINPWEVHINDPTYWDVLYSNNKLEKDPWYYRAFGSDGATVCTVSPELHRIRRGAMANFFSRANVAKLEPRVLSRVQQLCSRLEEHKDRGKAVDISNAFRCLATDIVTDYAAPRTRDFLSTPDFAAAFNRVLRDFSGLMHWHRHIPVVFTIMTSIPRGFIEWMDPTGANVAIIDNQADLLFQARAVVEQVPRTKETPTVLNEIYDSPTLSPSDKSLKRIFDETQAVLGAGTETTGNTLSVLTYYVLANPSILQNLRSELESAAIASETGPNILLTSRILEPLPYLQATIKEALRVSSSVSGRLPRRSPVSTMTYTSPAGQRYDLPPGTVVSMSMRDMHFNPSIFPNPYCFDPNRWIHATPTELERMEKAFVPFGRGVRGCIGLELAKQELLLVTGNMFWKFDMRLYATTEKDVGVEHDYFSPFGPGNSKGVRINVIS
ncbi:putative cytochrome P450 [Zopfia rhizophila CBS 207.26]|uniref:Putative cytochrome P450 n=1 Tax=Zopfia rhizophila CBS 207.26 TaxID=1314779 RepID=A0A6A6EDY2_9PEZI|nr:putative cytochrome P450 [Zopfia rhizophila CBS 207.26]